MTEYRVVVLSTWQDFIPVWPFFREPDGTWRLFVRRAERRRVLVNGRKVWQKREREMTEEESWNEQW